MKGVEFERGCEGSSSVETKQGGMSVGGSAGVEARIDAWLLGQADIVSDGRAAEWSERGL